MKLMKTIALVGGMSVAAGAQAAATSEMTININWASLSITDATGADYSFSPYTFTDPLMGETFYSDAEGWVGLGSNEVGNNWAANGADAYTSYTDASVFAEAGYQAGAEESGGHVAITDQDVGYNGASAWAGAYRGFMFTAPTNATVTFSVDYSLVGSLTTETAWDYADGGYSLFMDAADIDVWLTAYNDALANGSTAAEAELMAEQTLLGTPGVYDSYEYSDYQLAQAFGCMETAPCVTDVSLSDVMTVTLDVVAGGHYFFGADVNVNGYSDSVNPVPVPAAVWLFGSGLLGLVGVARRKHH